MHSYTDERIKITRLTGLDWLQTLRLGYSQEPSPAERSVHSLRTLVFILKLASLLYLDKSS